MAVYGIIGPREFRNLLYDNYDYLSDVLENYTDIDAVISGGAKGTEKLVEDYCERNEVELSIVRPNIRKYGQDIAFSHRNMEIVGSSDVMLVFWDGVNTKIHDTLVSCMRIKREVTVIPLV